MPKILWKLDLQNTQNLKMLGGIFGKMFGPEKGNDPNFGLAELHFWAPSCVYGCRVWAENVVNQTSCVRPL